MSEPTNVPVADPVAAEAPTPEQSAEAAAQAVTDDKATLAALEAVHAAAVEAAKPKVLPYSMSAPSIITEDRGEVPAILDDPGGGHDFRVTIDGGIVYEHSGERTYVGDDGKPFQRWLYRRVN